MTENDQREIITFQNSALIKQLDLDTARLDELAQSLGSRDYAYRYIREAAAEIYTQAYEIRKTEHWRKCIREENPKISGMFGHWAYRIRKEQEFDEMVKAKNDK